MSQAKSKTAVDFGMLGILSLVILSIVAFWLGANPTTWFYPLVMAAAVYALKMLGVSVVPSANTLGWEHYLVFGGALASLVLLFVPFWFVWWWPAAIAYAVVTLLALVRRF